MQDKILKFLEHIGLDKEYYEYFNDILINKTLIDKNNNTYTFLLEAKEVLEIDIYTKLIDRVNNTFKDTKAYLVFNVETVDYNKSLSYIDYYMMNFSIDYKCELTDNIITININKYENYLNLLKETDKLNKFLNNIGFVDINLKLKNKTNEDVLYGQYITETSDLISNINTEMDNAVVDGVIFGIDYFESNKSNINIITIKITDYMDSIYAKIFSRDKKDYEVLKKQFKENMCIRIKGIIKQDKYSKELVITPTAINKIDNIFEETADTYDEKRVELHTHTFMTQMDSVVSTKNLIRKAIKFKHKAIAITDKSSVQSFPEAYSFRKDIKVIYGVELSVIDDNINVVLRPSEKTFKDTTFVVFDFETTGFNAFGGDSIIEIGAVKIRNGEILEKYNELIKPKEDIKEAITNITNITNEMLIGKRKEEEAIKDFLDWIEDCPLVAHNAKFDISFIESAIKKYDLKSINNELIDTLQLSRLLDSNESRHSLQAIVKRYDVEFDEDNHHRADYDAYATALVFDKMIKTLLNRNIEKINELETKLINKDEIHKINRPYHLILLAKNNTGLKNIFKLVTLSNTKYLYKTPRILKSEIIYNRDGLLIGSACYNGEIFNLASSKSEEELSELISFYDYIEIQPLDTYNHLIQTGKFDNIDKVKETIYKIINVAEKSNRLAVATGDVHHLEKNDLIKRKIIINQKVPGGGLHPLANKSITSIPSTHFRTTNEMMEDFLFLGFDKAYELVIKNSNLIESMIEDVEVIKKELYTPKMNNSKKLVTEMTYNKAYEIYGNPLPKVILERLEKELNGIINSGFDVIYLIAQKLVKKSNDDGYIVGSRGSVGSSLVATMMGITEVNPLPPHYICPKCKKTLFSVNNKSLGEDYQSGYDLPDMMCSCGTNMLKEGQDIPFATFLGFNADKVPDIDLNFSGDYQAIAHDYTKELFGEKNVFRAGTIATVADKTAFGFVKGYLEDKNVTMRNAEIERLSTGITGVKRTSGQHPGGIIVIPDYKDIFDFTPYQYPADDTKSKWYTSHFDYHSIEENVLKLDILGHDNPTLLKMLSDLTEVDIEKIPFDDAKVISLFTSTKALNVTKEDILYETGTLGIPEFGTDFALAMLLDTKPTTFAELVKISGLSHGTDVWIGNAQELIKNKVIEFKEVIGCRDDIMVYLIYKGLPNIDAFKIMEFVRKGKATKDVLEWAKYVDILKEHNIEDWYIESCRRIKYMFPKAHACAYVMMSYRVAFFKLYYPLEYYATYFSIKFNDFDINTLLKGETEIKNRIIEINNKGYEATNKENNIKEFLKIAYEMYKRGYKFLNVDIYKSDYNKFIIDRENKALVLPFKVIDGLGFAVSNNIIIERDVKKFISIEDFKNRTKISTTLIEKLKILKILSGLNETSQLTFNFDL